MKQIDGHEEGDMSLERRDFLRFGAGTVLGAILPGLGDVEKVKLATPLEVERLTGPRAGIGDLVWRSYLYRRVDGKVVEPYVLGITGHVDGSVLWQASPDDRIIYDTGHFGLRALRRFQIFCDTEAA